MSKENQTKTGGRDATGGVIPGRFALSVGKPETPTPDGWEWVKLTDVARIETGHTPARKHPEYWDGEISWVGIKDATSNHGFVIDDTFQHVTQKGIDNSSARVLPANTVCLSRTASVGYVIVMGKPMATSQDFVNWVCSEKIDHRYLASILYAENSSFSLFSRGTTHQTIYLPEAKAFHVLLPSIEIQRKIANIVWGMIDKIQLNRQTNQTLEHMAQAIFKSWFVNFEPTRAKIAAKEEWAKRSITAKSGGSDNNIKESQAEATFVERAAMAAISGRAIDSTNDSATGALAGLDQLNPEQIQQLKTTAALFPDTLVDSELGEIPEGWEVKGVGDIVERHKPIKRYTKKQVVPFGDIPVFEQGASILLGYHNDEAGFIASTERPLFIFGDHTCVIHLSCENFDISQNVIPLSGSVYPTIWVYYAVQGKQEFQEYRRHWSEFIIKEVIAPKVEITKVYSEFITTLYSKKEQAVRENKSLEQLRDSLLPKLLSGDLPI